MPSFPLVRAGDVAPFERWLRESGRQVERVLAAAGLRSSALDEPERPVPLAFALGLMRSMSRQEGPDIGLRAVAAASVADLGPLGAVMLGAATPREALTRAAAAMARHSTHEHLAVVPHADGVIVHEHLGLDVDAETRHVVHQYVASLIRELCLLTGAAGEPIAHVMMAPHPEVGLAHLEGRLAGELEVAAGRALSICVPAAVIDRPLPVPARRPGGAEPAADWMRLAGDRSYAGTAGLVVEAMIRDGGVPSIDELAAAGGVSVRTLQRRLAAEGTSFSRLFDGARRSLAVRELAGSRAPIAHIAADLGYSGGAAFSRAVRRWTDLPPRMLRRDGAGPDPA